jgi:hypothetical protein
MELEQITDMHDDAMAFGKHYKAVIGMTVNTGRKGWKKVLESKGWKEQFTTLLKEF